ncbi:Hok/Gef family protein [Photobacterium sp. GB-56]|uniref:Hok/Gef family protein n=1 Tax=Photobacterium sp. GB-56 TaxID=2022106 RepID=UPI000D1821E7|nr:hypothetical protein C9J42_05045 [Photobacterium sp. GB-56]
MVKKFTSVTLCAIVCLTILIFCFMFRSTLCGVELKNGDTIFKANMACAVQNLPSNNI